MRDHPSHNGYMLAGLWGAKVSQDREKIGQLAVEMLDSTPRHYWDFDQALLRRIVWPVAVQSCLQHDSYSCTFAKFNAYHKTQPFPTQRQNGLYVGWGPIKTLETNSTGIKACPRKCRSKPEWTFCWIKLSFSTNLDFKFRMNGCVPEIQKCCDK